ncbi:MAG: acetylxylan esterase [Clostridia bacterium]|nr:acetylxylan esterase [Clostridia bacterium]
MKILDDRELLPILDGEKSWEERRKELLDILATYEYGFTPKRPEIWHVDLLEENKNAFAGKAVQRRMKMYFLSPGGMYFFYFYTVIPYSDKKVPAFLHINFRKEIPDRYQPTEEIIDRGYSVCTIYYNDIVPDSLDSDFTKGIAPLFVKNNERSKSEWGKIGMWAYAASRVIDYLVTVPEIDENEISVIGHSRLGKTALWCGAQDERVYCTISNCSGYGGAAIAKGGSGEKIHMFEECGSKDWFCPAFTDYSGKDDEKPYDQHFLLACIAPRYLCVGSAIEDYGADPESEFLSRVAASEAYRLYGKTGLKYNGEKFPETGTHLSDGEIGYHIRKGRHFLSREDWNFYMDFLDKKRIEKEKNHEDA